MNKENLNKHRKEIFDMYLDDFTSSEIADQFHCKVCDVDRLIESYRKSIKIADIPQETKNKIMELHRENKHPNEICNYFKKKYKVITIRSVIATESNTIDVGKAFNLYFNAHWSEEEIAKDTGICLDILEDCIEKEKQRREEESKKEKLKLYVDEDMIRVLSDRYTAKDISIKLKLPIEEVRQVLERKYKEDIYGHE